MTGRSAVTCPVCCRRCFLDHELIPYRKFATNLVLVLVVVVVGATLFKKPKTPLFQFGSEFGTIVPQVNRPTHRLGELDFG